MSELPTEEWTQLIKFAAYVGAQAVTSLGAVHGVPKLDDQPALRKLVNDVTVELANHQAPELKNSQAEMSSESSQMESAPTLTSEQQL